MRGVFFDHDGGIDDFLALLLLVAYERLDLLGVSITPADTYIEPATSVTRKILRLAGRPDVPVAAGTLEGRNSFPHLFRMDSLRIDALPQLDQGPHTPAPLVDEPGQELLARTLLQAAQPVTLLMTGPLTNLAWALHHHPQVEAKVEELVLMGGALEVPGNVHRRTLAPQPGSPPTVELLDHPRPGHDGSAEWNIYWDPAAAKRVWDSGIPITLFSLDSTNQVPVTDDFRRALARQRHYPLSEAAGTIWAITAGYDYYCWDTLATSHLAAPHLCSFRRVPCDVLTHGPSQGRTVISEGGREVKVAERVDAEAFYAHCLTVLQRGSALPTDPAQG